MFMDAKTCVCFNFTRDVKPINQPNRCNIKEDARLGVLAYYWTFMDVIYLIYGSESNGDPLASDQRGLKILNGGWWAAVKNMPHDVKMLVGLPVPNAKSLGRSSMHMGLTLPSLVSPNSFTSSRDWT
jgi:hypothetical protein